MSKTTKKWLPKPSQISFLATGLLLTSTAIKAENKTPNVIYIMADDLGIGDLGCYGQRMIKTPTIDKMARNGMKFMNHYSGSTVSAPSRCSLLTGMHTGHCYVRGNGGHKGKDGRYYDTNLPTSEITVAELFKQKGYQTACCGKWGLGGPDKVSYPNKQGFDYFFGYLGQLNAHFYYPGQLFENNTPVNLHKKKYSHDLIMKKALSFVNKNSDKPFFLYLTPTIPHAEITVPNNELMGYKNKFLEKPYHGTHYCSTDFPKATFAAMVSRLDRDVAKLIQLLKEKGILDNTLIIFTSDNGTHCEGGHDPYYFNSNGPFRGIKRDLYGGGIRAPFIAQWNGVIPKGSVSYHRSAFWDFMPTICDLIDVKTPKCSDGISYLPTLTGKRKQKKHDHLYFEFHEGGGKQAVIKGEWKLIKLFVNRPNKTRYELYNIKEDAGELANVINQYPKIARKLKKIMEKSHTPNPIFKFANEK